MAFNFSTGDTVELEISQSKDKKYKTIVDEANGDQHLYVYAPIEQGKVVLVPHMASLKVVFSQYNAQSSQYEIFRFKAQLISKITKDGVSMFELRRTGDIKKIQRRDYFRLSLVDNFSVMPSNGQAIECLSRDISAGGMRFVSPIRLKMGDTVTCHVTLDPKAPLQLVGQVVNVDFMPESVLKYDIRVKFLDMPKAQERKMIQQINHMQSTYLKKSASRRYDDNMAEVMAHFSPERMDQYNKDTRFNVRLGYFIALDWLLVLIMLALFVIARPDAEYPVAVFFNIRMSDVWNAYVLTLNMWLGIFTFIYSLVGILLHYNHYRGRVPLSMNLVVCAVGGLMTTLIVFTMFQTILST